jgi:hypothetical protein
MAMQQKINFYPLLPRKIKSRFTKQTLYLAYGLFLVFMCLHYFNAVWKKHKLTKEYNQEVVLLEQANKKFENLLKQYPSVDTKNIQTIGESMRAELNNELKILELLAQSSIFSNYLQALAQASIPDVWLNDILFAPIEPHIVLKGNALQPMQAQKFLDQLSLQAAFVNLPLNLIDISQITLPNGVIISFNITTKSKSPA